MVDISITDEKSLSDVSDLLQSAQFGPFDIVDSNKTELRISLTRHCLEDWTALSFTKTIVPGFLRVSYPLTRSQLTITGLTSVKRRGPDQFELAEFEYIKKHSRGFKLKAEPITWELTFAGQPFGSLKDMNTLSQRGSRIHMTNLGLALTAIFVAIWVAAAIWFRIS